MRKSEQIENLTVSLGEAEHVIANLRAELVQQRKSTDFFAVKARSLREDRERLAEVVRNQTEGIQRLGGELNTLREDRKNLLYVIEGYLDDRVNTEHAINGLCDTIDKIEAELAEARDKVRQLTASRDGWKKAAYAENQRGAEYRDRARRIKIELKHWQDTHSALREGLSALLSK